MGGWEQGRTWRQWVLEDSARQDEQTHMDHAPGELLRPDCKKIRMLGVLQGQQSTWRRDRKNLVEGKADENSALSSQAA